MHIKVVNPKEDQYGNSKENIFLAFNDDGEFLGSSYAYPSINYHQTYETPYIIFININADDSFNESLKNEVKQELFSRVFERAKELRNERLNLIARIYSAFEYDEEKMSFYINNGFERDYSIIMEAHIQSNFNNELPDNIKIIEQKIESDQDFTEYKNIYDNIFITRLDRDALEEQMKCPHFKILSFFIDDKLAGGCTFFEKDGFGYIETVFVVEEHRGKGLSKVIMNYILGYFDLVGLKKTKLEVWELNKRAVELYKSFGYTEVRKNLMFPGITM
ncbi:GNAT family N-acetyltransferase [Clostridium sp. YIM B02515]|uniref:GNAT family N-acetyltransferase n=1 Tax=Clostridium rhizosphaerae TaxID=2803861 RepID=A0ABS1T4T3_9CLOT|nr:GNAT family N-acetyltransferase [Clostridium rhizosphaerae]MBL4934348.1 GNAT family N-acetyltransferase [Clostridium rhizosphaerae]